MHSSEVKEDTHDSFRRITAEVICAGENELRVRVAAPSLFGEMPVWIHRDRVNSEFDETLCLLEPGSKLNLVDVIIVDGGLLPRFLILEPDYLVDASALAECAQEYGTCWQRYFWNRIRPKTITDSILLGNAVNLIFDELITAKDFRSVTFDSLMPKIFARYPIEFVSAKSVDRRFFQNLHSQFETLKRILSTDFSALGIDRRKAMVEPSFICEALGLQGRLDFLQVENGLCGIELKAGRPPYPENDLSKVSFPHRAQCALYQSMIQGVLGIKLENQHFYLLYSRNLNPEGCLRPVKTSTRELQKLLNLRNKIVSVERDISRYGYVQAEWLVSRLTADNLIPRPSLFTERYIRPEIDCGRRRLERRDDNDLALRYFYRFYAFVSREHYLSKIGYPSGSGISGVASLWRMTRDEKEREGYMFSGLRLVRNRAAEDIPEVEFILPGNTPSPDFRLGDIVLFYVCDTDADRVSTRQVFKATIASMTADRVVLRLRDNQSYAEALPIASCYAVEHDYVDSSFLLQYKGLYTMLDASPHRRGLLVGEAGESPVRNMSRRLSYEYDSPDLSRILLKALQAEDYFLLVGPPGTGKTSVALRNMVREFLAIPDYQILLVAFTNRAVDEICDKLETIGEVDDYIRVGQTLSCDVAYRSHLLSERMKQCRNREEANRSIHSCRVFVATLSSLSGKMELFNLKRFDVAIVDEASQILEPQLVGLLSAKTPTGRDAIGKFILIGDHKQLPAVVVQSAEESVITDERLRSAGFVDCRISLFERLYRRLPEGSPFADMLDCQWRMHPDIASFANTYFYKGALRDGNAPHQISLLPFTNMGDDKWERVIATKRTAFFPTKTLCAGKKYNNEEACKTAAIVNALYRLYERNGLEFDERSVGVITPYRHQIARIRQELDKFGISAFDTIRVDTVERFQGSQNDCIIYSFCVNDESQLEWLPSYTEESGQLIDRKLNVALTRARRQLFVLGNSQLLSRNPIYRILITRLENISSE
ncbi:AAA domain-containing protein [Barnesiella intestinihominis]|uniref:AAA domain-containing protein n=1 Tax=Barnesiella intestinihominis TaxID=487174 RepID=UPI003AB7549E